MWTVKWVKKYVSNGKEWFRKSLEKKNDLKMLKVGGKNQVKSGQKMI